MLGPKPRRVGALAMAMTAAGCGSDPPSLPDGADAGSGGSTAASGDGGGDGDPAATDATSPSGADATGSGGADTIGYDDTGPTSGPDATSDGGPNGNDKAFRFNYLQLVDPHLFFDPLGDVTQVLNEQFFVWFDPENGDGDGNMEAGLALVFRPLDQSDGAMGQFEYWNADCPVDEGGNVCAPAPGKLGYITDYTSFASAVCLEPDVDHLDDNLRPPPTSVGPCFVNAPFDVIIEAGDLALPLQQAEVSARYVGDPSLNLVTGVLRGFLTEQAANDTNTTVDALGKVSLDTVLRTQDMDGDGWWLYFEFTALAVDWGG